MEKPELISIMSGRYGAAIWALFAAAVVPMAVLLASGADMGNVLRGLLLLPIVSFGPALGGVIIWYALAEDTNATPGAPAPKH